MFPGVAFFKSFNSKHGQYIGVIVCFYIFCSANLKKSHLYLFRDNRGREVDIIHDSVTSIDILEIKSSSIFRTSFLKGLNYIKTLPVDINSAYLVCGGDESYERDGVNIRTWRNVPML